MKPAYSPILFGKVSDKGVFVPNNKVLARKILLGLAGKAVEFIIRPYRSKRSIAQNRYYWGVVVNDIAEFIGEHDRDRVHRILAGKFLKHQDIIELPNGKREVVETILSTATLSKDEFFDVYIEQCRQWAAEFLELVIPDPSEIDLAERTFEK